MLPVSSIQNYNSSTTPKEIINVVRLFKLDIFEDSETKFADIEFYSSSDE